MFEGPIPRCFVAAATLAVACCAVNDAERVASVKPGMTPQQVERHMGRVQSVIFNFDNAGYHRNFHDIDPVTKNMTTARAVALPPDWDPELKDWLTQTAKTNGPIKSVCTVHTLGVHDYECCFANGRLLSIAEKIWPSIPIPAAKSRQ
jgi:hypothetical protein